MVMEEMGVVIVEAVLMAEESRKLLVKVEEEETEVVRPAVEVDGVEEAEGDSVEVNETVETNEALPAVFAVPVACPLEAVAAAPALPPDDVVAWSLILGHKSCTPCPFLKAEITSLPGS